ncbi:MAG: hypothetical protein ACERKO_10975, partial [Acetanaerobacterium sp.]
MFFSKLVLMGGGGSPHEPVLTDLALWYDGINNTGSGHSASPSSWFDLSGNGNHGSLIQGVSWERNCAVFNRGQVDTGYTLPRADWTVEIAFEPSEDDRTQAIISQWTGTTARIQYEKHATNRARIYTNN